VTTENDKDEAVSARYRELRRGEPPSRVDDAILAASRRAVQAAPRSGGTRRWYVPVSLAAAVMLTVLVTLNVREERPDLESPVAVAEAPPPVEARPAPAAESAPVAQPAPPPAIAASKPAPQRNEARARPQFAPEPGPVAGAKPAEAPSAAAPVPAAPAPPATAGAGAATGELASQAPARAMARSAPMELRERADLRDRAEASAQRDSAMAQRDTTTAKRAEDAPETPERMLERIAVLRTDGKHAEADKLLAEFRQRHPQYRIPGAMLEKVNPPR